MKFILFACVFFLPLFADEPKPTEGVARFMVEIKLECPPSKELDDYMKSIPEMESGSFEEWKKAFVKSMNAMIRLVESGKVTSGEWSVAPQD